LKKLKENKDVQRLHFMNPMRKIWKILSEQEKRLIRWKDLKRVAERESYSPLLHLVNKRIVQILVDCGYGINEACRKAARLYVGFDLFSERKRLFRLDGGAKKSQIDLEVIWRSGRVKQSYHCWKDRENELEERLKFDYRCSDLIIL